jgi:hypothetical protein
MTIPNRRMKPFRLRLALPVSALILAVLPLAGAQEPSTAQAQPQTIGVVVATERPDPVVPSTAGQTFTESFLDAFRHGKMNLNVRLRYEWVEQEPTAAKEAHALTLRTRLGYTTAPLHGVQGMLEFENISALSNDKLYRLPGSPAQVDRPVVADPETTEINQAWLSYSNWNSTIRGGRQRIVLDNHRFIGDVGWRQNQQTFDAATFSSSPLNDLDLYYGYVWHVNRVFGDVRAVGPVFRDFDSDSHLVRLAYNRFPIARLVAYTYLLDLENAAGHGNSSATYGLALSGSHTFDPARNARLNHRAEYAFQTDYAEQPARYSAHYLRAELSGDYDRFTLGAGCELLGSGRNRNQPGTRVGFKTPLATLHAFNGWADVFLATPDDGLRDLHAFLGARLPGDVPIRIVYHKYYAHRGGADYGQEINFIASRAFGRHFSALLKYAYYDGKDSAVPAIPAPFDKHLFWAQIEFNF